MFENSLCCQEYVELSLKYQPWPQKLVEKGYGTFLTADQAAFRAKLVANVAKQLKLNWSLRAEPLKDPRYSEILCTPVYEIPGTDFGRSDDENVPESQKAHGVGLNWGSLHRLGRICEIGYRLFPKTFPTIFTSKLRAPTLHLSTVEELFWLDVWHNPINISPEFAFPSSKKRIDWRFSTCGVTVNLEVKYRPKDWMRRVDGPDANVVKSGYYEDTIQKFTASLPNELNLVAISSYCEPEPSWFFETEKLLKNYPHIHGVILWCPTYSASDGGGPFNIQSSQKQIVRCLMNPKREDSEHLIVVRHLWRNSKERREARIDEMIQDMTNLLPPHVD